MKLSRPFSLTCSMTVGRCLSTRSLSESFGAHAGAASAPGASARALRSRISDRRCLAQSAVTAATASRMASKPGECRARLLLPRSQELGPRADQVREHDDGSSAAVVGAELVAEAERITLERRRPVDAAEQAADAPPRQAGESGLGHPRHAIVDARDHLVAEGREIGAAALEARATLSLPSGPRPSA